METPFCGASDGTFGVGRDPCSCFACIRDTYPSGNDSGCSELSPKCADDASDIPAYTGGSTCINPENWTPSPSVSPTEAPAEKICIYSSNVGGYLYLPLGRQGGENAFLPEDLIAPPLIDFTYQYDPNDGKDEGANNFYNDLTRTNLKDGDVGFNNGALVAWLDNVVPSPKNVYVDLGATFALSEVAVTITTVPAAGLFSPTSVTLEWNTC